MAIFRKGIKMGPDDFPLAIEKQRGQGILRKLDIIKDGNAYYVGMVGVKGGNTYIKFTHKSAGGIWLKGLKKDIALETFML